MKSTVISSNTISSIFLFLFVFAVSFSLKGQEIDKQKLAWQYYKDDKDWFLENIPFFECSDKTFEEVYYYRWKLYKAHIRNIGPGKNVITEFIIHMSFDRDPFCTINAASMHHIYEGRWLNNKKYVNSYIDYLYQMGGNNRSYSESIADASYANFLVSGDKDFAVKQLDSMVRIYNAWYDHWDDAKQLFYIPAMPDATEYNIAAIDASGGTGGFEGGEAFRPTINSYQYGNAIAIARIAELKGEQDLSKEFSDRASALKSNIQKSLWNEKLQHFTDRYKVSNNYVNYWDFIRGRELAGYAPWYFNLPDDDPKYYKAFSHLTDTSQLSGRYGFRTNEPSYEYYFRQYAYYEGMPSSQWNGPNWPFQTSITLTGMANFLQHYKQNVISVSDYLHSLRLFAQQHYLPDGTLNLVENYDPNKGGPIVLCEWSNHYLHSTFNNLIITGLCGFQPMADETLKFQPLIDNSILYFSLSDVNYHGHKVSVLYDKTGEKYHSGKGFKVFIDGVNAALSIKDNTYTVQVGKTIVRQTEISPENLVLNIHRHKFPAIRTSVNNSPELLNMLNDGRIWFFPEVDNRWISLASPNVSDWIEVEFDAMKEFSQIHFYPYIDNKTYLMPEAVSITYLANGIWKDAEFKEIPVLTPNTRNIVRIVPVKAKQIRVHFKHIVKQIAISEIEIYK